MTSTRAEQKVKTRAAILASAADLLRRRGIEASSVLDVMRGAGLTVGGFYGHFDSKESLFAETIRHAAREKWDALLASCKAPTGPERALEIVRKYVNRTHRDQPAEGCLLPNAIPDAARAEGAPYRAVLADEIGQFAKSLGATIGGDDAREHALGLVALMYGALALSRGLAGTPLSDEILTAARKLAARSV